MSRFVLKYSSTSLNILHSIKAKKYLIYKKCTNFLVKNWRATYWLLISKPVLTPHTPRIILKYKLTCRALSMKISSEFTNSTGQFSFQFYFDDFRFDFHFKWTIFIENSKIKNQNFVQPQNYPKGQNLIKIHL